jgi:hypothetical protein
MQAKDQTAPQVNGHVNGVNGHAPVKVEEKEKLDKHQLDRLATGVTVDTGGQTSPIVRTFIFHVGDLHLILVTGYGQGRKTICNRATERGY